jgi:hypothetical protein
MLYTSAIIYIVEPSFEGGNLCTLLRRVDDKNPNAPAPKGSYMTNKMR